VSKYARGGSARTVSARKVYVVADAISAHFATNGWAGWFAGLAAAKKDAQFG
jgi:hypothetical protein